VSELLERERELAQIDALVAGLADGQGRMLLVDGPAGIGKSRLLDAVADAASGSGARVLSARGSELEREFPFGVVRQLFEPLLAGAAERDRVLAGSAAPARPVFEPLEDAMADPSFAVLHGLYWGAVNLAGEQPLVLVVDDLHWCDRSSLRFLAYLVRRLAGLPVLVAAARRPSEPGTDAALMGELAGDAQTATLNPGALTTRAAAELVRERLGADADDGFCDACHEATGGNPLLLRELLAAIEAEGVKPTADSSGVVRELGPRAASRAVLMRLARLPADAIAVARAVAVLGDGTDLAAVTALAGVSDAGAARSTGALAQAEILRPEAPLGFVHPLVRDVVYNDIPAGERELAHAAAAQLLAEAGASPDAIAAHVLAMPRRGEPWVVDVLAGAARGALGRGAAESAVAYLRRALEEPPADDRRAEILYALGIAEAMTSGPSAAEHLRAAYDAIPDPLERARLATILAETYTFTGRSREAAQIAIEAAAGLPEDEIQLREALWVSRTLNAHFDPGADPEAAAPVDPGEISGTGTAALMLQMQAAFDLARQGRPAAECIPLLVGAIRDREFIAGLRGGGTFALMVFLLALADRPEALHLCDVALADAHRSGSLFAACGSHIFRGYVLTRHGDLPAGEEMLKTGFEEIEAWGIEPGRSHGSAFLSDLYVERGDVASARAAFERAGVPDDPPPLHHLVWWLVSRVRLLLAEGRYEEALGRAHDLSRRFDGVFDNPAFVPWRSQAAQALLGLGRAEEAAALAEEEAEMARVWGTPRPIARALQVQAIADPDLALPRLREAVGLLEGSPAKLEFARALTALGTALRRDRQPAEAREPLGRALEIAGQCDASTLVEHIRSEIYATGARPRQNGAGGIGALTASERRVVDLAAEGRSTHDIAQALYVTPRTIDVHLGNAFQKLGVRSRRELSSVLTEA
jgi:DNA-binding CsgD family transcriptional regulator